MKSDNWQLLQWRFNSATKHSFTFPMVTALPFLTGCNHPTLSPPASRDTGSNTQAQGGGCQGGVGGWPVRAAYSRPELFHLWAYNPSQNESSLFFLLWDLKRFSFFPKEPEHEHMGVKRLSENRAKMEEDAGEEADSTAASPEAFQLGDQ